MEGMRFHSAHSLWPFIAATLAMLMLAGVVWVQMQTRLGDNDVLDANIAEMARIDEVLTTSALLATATGDPAYRDRYYDHVETLDTLLAESMGLFPSERAEQMLRKTGTANIWLVETEERALRAMRDGPNPVAYGSLRSAEYARHKSAYAQGLQASIRELETLAEARVTMMRQALTALGLVVALVTAIMVLVVVRARAEHRELARRQEQVVAMRGMIRTFMDLQNNLLNNMVYLRTRAAHDLSFDANDIRMIDDEIERSRAKLSELAGTGIVTTRDLGGIVVADTGGSALDRAA